MENIDTNYFQRNIQTFALSSRKKIRTRAVFIETPDLGKYSPIIDLLLG